ncbi:DUF5691 domain-containing protein [Gordonia sp. DT219]|uniref:DUF5691 domain-containing protein n=1 Tax=Gordonia sp. DT219 TaxID=3416658 RepID=UPI003CF78547
MSSWDEVVSAALVGVRSRPVTTADADPVLAAHLPDDATPDDPAVVALQLAALTAAAHGASGPGSVAAEPIPAAPDDPRPPMSDLAAAYAIQALEHSPRLASWGLDLLVDSGRRPPARMLPGLVARTARNVAGQPVISTIVGPRGRWLAQHAPQLRAVLDGTGALAADTADATAWTHGEPAARVAYLTALRSRDPDAARKLLEAGWAGETGTDRELLLPVLSHTPSLADEAFLERALDDRRAKVRATAADILDHVDGSAHQQRLFDAAAALLTLTEERRRLQRHPVLHAAMPTDPDPALARDGISRTAPRGVGLGTHTLTQLFSRIPPRLWQQHFNLSADALVAAIDAGQRALVAGLCAATTTFADRRWATALMRHPDALPAVMALADSQAVQAEFTRLPPERQLAALPSLPTPWPEPLANNIFRLFGAEVARPGRVTPAAAQLADLMQVGLPATDTWRDTVDTTRERLPAATIVLARLSDALRIRAALLRELT